MLVWYIIFCREIGKGSPSRPTAQKPVVGQKVVGPRTGPSSLESVSPSIASFKNLPLQLQNLPPNRNLPQGPQGPNQFPPAPFLNQIPMTDPTLRHLPQNLVPYGQPSAPVQIPGLPPQQFQIRPPAGITPVHPQVNQSAIPQVSAQGYNPALWQQAHGGHVAATGGYSVPPQMGQIHQNFIRSTLPGQPQAPLPNSFRQPIQTGMPQSSSAQQIVQGQTFTTQSIQSIPSTTQRGVFPGQNLPTFSPIQVQPIMPGQTQQQSGLPTGYHPMLLPQSQPQLGPSGQITVSQPQGALISGQAQTHPHSSLSNQAHPGQLPQNRPQQYMGYATTSFPSSQPLQVSAPQQVHPRSQLFPQVPSSQNSQVPFGLSQLGQPQMTPGAIPPQNNMYPFTPTQGSQQPMGQQPVPPQFNPMFNGSGGQPMHTPGQSQLLGPQHLAYPSSGQTVVAVMDNPVPPSLANTLIPTPSPFQVSSQSETTTPKPDMPTSSFSTQNFKPQTTNAAPINMNNLDSATVLDSVQNKVDNLSIG